jgi:TRAP-type uncharacterized transport system fused permease subunit
MKWFFLLVLCAVIGVVLYGFGVPYWAVYIVRGIVRHFAYHH